MKIINKNKYKLNMNICFKNYLNAKTLELKCFIILILSQDTLSLDKDKDINMKNYFNLIRINLIKEKV